MNSFIVLVLLRYAKIYEIDFVHLFLINNVISNHDVIWFDIAMYVACIMQAL